MVRLGILQTPFSLRLTITYTNTCNPLHAGPPQQDDNQATGLGKEDLEKVMRHELLQMLYCRVSSSKVSHGDGYQQLSSSPFTGGRHLFLCPDLLEAPRQIKSPPASPRPQQAIISQRTQK